MYANYEIGTIQPIREVSYVVHEKGLYLNVYATTAAGKIHVDVQKDGIDLLTGLPYRPTIFMGHKVQTLS